MVTAHKDISKFPTLSDGVTELTKRAKGISRAYHQYVTFSNFEDLVVRDLPTRKIIIGSLKRQTFRIYLIRTRKKILSKFNSKRCFSEKYKKDHSYFSFPLHFKAQRLIS